MEEKKKSMVRLPREICPERLGLSGRAMMDFEKRLEDEDIEYHTIMFIRHGKVAAECSRFPFTTDTVHCMYSISKNITSLAVGFAVNEKLLSLDTRLLDIFPEFTPAKRDRRLEKLTIKHLITMTSGKEPSYLLDKTKGDWAHQLLNTKWTADPGMHYRYTSENIYMLCAVIQKLTGQTVVEYLRPRLWEPLSIETPYWETDENGIEAGGWGIQLRAEDFAKIFVCIEQRGMWQGKQVIPFKWLNEAVLNYKRSFRNGEPGGTKTSGYGYTFWRDEENFYGEGMFGQIGYTIQSKDFVFIVTSGQCDTGKLWRAFRAYLQEAFITPIPDAPANEELNRLFSTRRLDIIPAPGERSPLEQRIEGKKIDLPKNTLLNAINMPFSVLPIPARFMLLYRAGNADDYTFSFGEDTCTLSWSEGDENVTVECGMDGQYRYTPVTLARRPYTFAGAAFWTNDNELTVWLRPMEAIARRILTFRFDGDRVTVIPSTSPDIDTMMKSVTNEVRDSIKSGFLKKKTGPALRKIESIVEPEMHGTLKQAGK